MKRKQVTRQKSPNIGFEYGWVHYKSILKVKDGGKYPVSLEMKFAPPRPFAFNMPESHSIKGISITDVYVQVVRFFNKFDIEFRN